MRVALPVVAGLQQRPDHPGNPAALAAFDAAAVTRLCADLGGAAAAVDRWYGPLSDLLAAYAPHHRPPAGQLYRAPGL
jgi:hypothetical protein